MRISNLFVFLLALSFSNSVLSDDVDTLGLDAPQFNLGMVGFAGRISEAEVTMLNIKKRVDAESVFISIVEDESRGTVAKLYALCGLKSMRSALFGPVFERMSRTQDTVSVMRGDVMTKEEGSDLVNQIKNGLC